MLKKGGRGEKHYTPQKPREKGGGRGEGFRGEGKEIGWGVMTVFVSHKVQPVSAFRNTVGKSYSIRIDKRLERKKNRERENLSCQEEGVIKRAGGTVLPAELNGLYQEARQTDINRGWGNLEKRARNERDLIGNQIGPAEKTKPKGGGQIKY